MKSPVGSGKQKADPTLLIHLPAVNLETITPWGKGQISDSSMPYPVFYKISKEDSEDV